MAKTDLEKLLWSLVLAERLRCATLVDIMLPNTRALEFGYVPNEEKEKLLKAIRREDKKDD